ncbi:MAG: ferritin-like domain-containing protein [Candidatus Nanopelagicales bacterium]
MSELEALEAAVAGEHAAVYAYGLVGGRLPADQQGRARSALDAHRARRDRLRARVVALGGTPPPAAIAYDPPFPVIDAESARALAAYVEDRLVPVYADLAAAVTGDERTEAVLTAREAAVRAVAWGGSPQAFPGG